MPYIPADDRDLLTPRTNMFADSAGELNFQITQLVIEYLNYNGLSYQICNDIVGALDGAKAEFQRRVVGPYEDRKIAENGDVYPADRAGDPDAY